MKFSAPLRFVESLRRPGSLCFLEPFYQLSDSGRFDIQTNSPMGREVL